MNFDQFLQLKERFSKAEFIAGRIVSGSMHPIIKVGDRIVIRQIDKPPKLMDILVFFQENKLICHFYVKPSTLSPEHYLTRPYAGEGFDFPVDKKNVLGIVCSHRISTWRKVLYFFSGKMKPRT